MAMKQRIHGQLLQLEQRDLEGQSAYTLRLLIEGLTSPHDIRAAYTQILTGLENCSRGAARSRLCVLQQALECHGSSVLAELVPASVQALLAYVRKQHHVVNLPELSTISATLMDCLLPNLSQDLLEGVAGPAQVLLLRQGNDKPIHYPHDWTEALLGLFKPILKVACKGPEQSAMTSACTMLSVMLHSCAGHVHFTPVVQSAVKLLAQLLTWTPPSATMSAQHATNSSQRGEHASCSPAGAQLGNSQLTRQGNAIEGVLRTLARKGPSHSVPSPYSGGCRLRSSGPGWGGNTDGLDRRAPGLLNIVQRCIQLMGIAADPPTLHAALHLCVLGATSSHWQMREAACTALGAAVSALCVQDPLFSEPALLPVQGVSKVLPPRSTGWLTRPGDDVLGQPTQPPIVMTPAVQVMCQFKGAVTIVLAEAKYDRVTAVRKAATAAAEQLTKLPGPAGLDLDIDPKHPDQATASDQATNRHKTPSSTVNRADQAAQDVIRSTRGRQDKKLLVAADRVTSKVTDGVRPSNRPDQQAVTAVKPGRLKPFKAPPRVSGFRKGMGGAGGAAAVYAAARPRHGFLQADKSRVCLKWSHRHEYHAQSHFQRPDPVPDQDLDFGIQVFAKPRPVRLVHSPPPAVHSPPPAAHSPTSSPAMTHSPARPPRPPGMYSPARAAPAVMRSPPPASPPDAAAAAQVHSPAHSAAASPSPGSPLRDIHIHIQTNFNSSNGTTPTASPRHGAEPQQLESGGAVHHVISVHAGSTGDHGTGAEGVTRVSPGRHQVQSVGTATSPTQSHPPWGPSGHVPSGPVLAGPVDAVHVSQAGSAVKQKHRSVAVGTETSWFVPLQSAAVSPSRASPGPRARQAASPGEGACEGGAGAARGSAAVPRAIDFRSRVQEAALMSDVQVVQAPPTPADTTSAVQAVQADSCALQLRSPSASGSCTTADGDVESDHGPQKSENETAAGPVVPQHHYQAPATATQQQNQQLQYGGDMGSDQDGVLAGQAVAVDGRSQLQQLAAGQQALDRMLSDIRKSQLLSVSNTLPSLPRTEEGTVVNLGRWPGAGLRSDAVVGPQAAHRSGVDVDEVAAHEGGAGQQQQEGPGQQQQEGAATAAGVPLPSPVAPATLAALRTTASAVAKSNSEALRDLEAMMQRLTVMKQELTGSHLTSPQMPTLPTSLATQAAASAQLPAGLTATSKVESLDQKPLQFPTPVHVSTAASQRLAALQAISARLGVVARAARAGGSAGGGEHVGAGQAGGTVGAEGIAGPAPLAGAAGVVGAAGLASAGPTGLAGAAGLTGTGNSMIVNSIIGNSTTGSIQSGLLSPAVLQSAWGTRPTPAPSPAAIQVLPPPPPPLAQPAHSSITGLATAQPGASSRGVSGYGHVGVIRSVMGGSSGYSSNVPLPVLPRSAGMWHVQGGLPNISPPASRSVSPQPAPPRSHTTLTPDLADPHISPNGLLAAQRRVSSPPVFNIRPPSSTTTANLGHLGHADILGAAAFAETDQYIANDRLGSTFSQRHVQQYNVANGGGLDSLQGVLPRPASPSSPPAFKPHLLTSTGVTHAAGNTALLSSPVMHWAATGRVAPLVADSPRFRAASQVLRSFSRPVSPGGFSSCGSHDGLNRGSSSPGRRGYQPGQVVISRRGRYDSPGRADDVGGRLQSSPPSRHVRHPLLHIRSPGSSRSTSPPGSPHHHPYDQHRHQDHHHYHQHKMHQHSSQQQHSQQQLGSASAVSSTRGSVALAAMWSARSPSAPGPAQHRTHSVTRDGRAVSELQLQRGGRYPAQPSSHPSHNPSHNHTALRGTTNTTVVPDDDPTSRTAAAGSSLAVQSAIQKLLRPNGMSYHSLYSDDGSGGGSGGGGDDVSSPRIPSVPYTSAHQASSLRVVNKAEDSRTEHDATALASATNDAIGDAVVKDGLSDATGVGSRSALITGCGGAVVAGDSDVLLGKFDVGLGEVLKRKAQGAVGRMANAMLARLRDEDLSDGDEHDT